MKWLQLGRKKKESIIAGNTAFGFRVGKLLLKENREENGNRLTEIRMPVSKSTEIRYTYKMNSHLIFAVHICLQI